MGRTYIHPITKEKYPSVTTVLASLKDAGLEKWRKSVGEEFAKKRMERAARFGTLFHAYAENYVLGEQRNEVKKNVLVELAFNKVKPIIDKNMSSLIMTESAIFHPTLRVAGRFDVMANWRGKPRIVDFKTATNDKKFEHIYKYYMQCSVYADAVGLDDFVILIAPENSIQGQVYEGTKEKWLPLFSKLRKKYLDTTGI